MLIDWIHWLSSHTPEQLLLLAAPILLVDAPRYALGSLLVWLVDLARLALRGGQPSDDERHFSHCPSLCVVIAGLNEAQTVGPLLASVWGSYPRLEIIVVDDGSTDGMSDVARRFAQDHPGVLVLTKPRRGGKSSALNFALPFARTEIIVCVDGDSHLGPAGLWEIVQPFADPRVGAVSGTVLARNPFRGLITWLQACEYLRCIFLGRMFASRLDILGIVSGAFGAFRAEALRRVGGWDVGPGEDGDLALRLRKSGYGVVFAPYAQCLTNLPTSWLRLIKQRRRWEWAVVTFECRKHVDLANPFSANFRWSNLLLLIDRWLFSVVLQYLFWAYVVWLCWHPQPHVGDRLLFYYACYLALEFLQLGIVVYYSNDRLRDLAVGLALPCMPLYHLLMRAVTCWAVSEEMLTRRSFRDGFVPEHVREATWHW
jgi:cellulose synthase/poly-beta-1,6-N-acetylglucosamine synthase-like glycosyltransferase